MDRFEIESVVLMIIRKIIDNKEVTDELIWEIDYKDTGLIDSMKFISLIFELERAFNIEVDINNLLIENFSEFVKIVTYIEGKFNS